MLLTGIDINVIFSCVPAHAFPLLSVEIDMKLTGFGKEIVPTIPKLIKYQHQGLVMSCHHSSELSI